MGSVIVFSTKRGRREGRKSVNQKFTDFFYFGLNTKRHRKAGSLWPIRCTYGIDNIRTIVSHSAGQGQQARRSSRVYASDNHRLMRYFSSWAASAGVIRGQRAAIRPSRSMRIRHGICVTRYRSARSACSGK